MEKADQRQAEHDRHEGPASSSTERATHAALPKGCANLDLLLHASPCECIGCGNIATPVVPPLKEQTACLLSRAKRQGRVWRTACTPANWSPGSGPMSR